jgi:hypothetical protein
MARGGFRPGAGRPKGRTGKTKTIPITTAGESLTPLQFMLRVLNDPKQDPDMRARMAIAAAPYVHPKAGEGKKNDRADRAKKAGAGKFAQGKAPFRVLQ